MKITRSLLLNCLLCLSTISLVSFSGFYQASLASCDPPPDQPKSSPNSGK